MSMENQSSSECQTSDSQSIQSQRSDSPSSQVQTSSGERKQGPKKTIRFKLHGIKRTLDDKVGMGHFHLETPYDPATSRFKKDTYPLHYLDVKDDDQIETLKIMKRLSHPNLLEVSLVNQVEGEGGVRVYVEPYTGVLSKLLKKWTLVNPKTNLIPSENFKGIVSEVIDGLSYLRENGEYHGNFAWATTFYLEVSNKVTAKLANLERKRSKSLKENQAADCVSLGFGLAEISEYAKERCAVPAVSCCLIDDLSSRLISVTTKTLDTVMDGIKDCVFFWDEKRRKTFWAVEVPDAWDRKVVETKFKQSESMPVMPWTNQLYNGYLAAMIAYRAENGIGKFDKNNWKDFLQCISGMYTHRTELDVAEYIRPVDSCVLYAHPRICLDLKAAMDQPPKDQPGQPPKDQPGQPRSRRMKSNRFRSQQA